MRSRKLRIALLAYMLLWFGVIVPGHRRGVVTFDSSGKASAESCCCCCNDKPADSSKVPAKPAHCAICDFTAHLTLPPVVDIQLTLLCRLGQVAPPIIEEHFAGVVPAPYNNRGPPVI